ncbi:type II secretion system F family protein [Patescibacteria group bacterium]|nr:type II secretion system F family protein [Patescibacteria group bacterium]MBU1705305.1 type II secretion system F family protein [Patescibacteria group bacterium]
MKFVYSATSQRKKKIQGTVEAPNRAAAIRRLKEKGLVVTSLLEIKKPKQYYLSPVSALEKVMLTKHLAIMLHSGISLDEALRIVELQAKGKLKPILTKIHEDVTSGELLADGLAKYPKVFNDYFVNMVRAGEQSGNLVENLEMLGKQFARDYELKKKSQSAMLYPSLVMGMTVGLGVIICTFVLPQLSHMFRAFKFELPLTTRMLIAVADYVNAYGVLTLILCVVGLILIIWLAKFRHTKPYFHWLYTRLPVVKTITLSVNLARFATVFGSMMKSGIPITTSLHTTAKVLGNEMFKRELNRAAAELDSGETLEFTLESSKFFPIFVSRMIGIGEKTGNLEDVLVYLQEYYENELDNLLKNLSTIIEPAMLIAIGVVVAVIALSIITPIYNFVGSVG